MPFSSLKRPQKKKQLNLVHSFLSLFFFVFTRCRLRLYPVPLHILNNSISPLLTVSIKPSFSGLFHAESEGKGVAAVYHVMWLHTCRTGSAIKAKLQCLHLPCCTSALAFYLCKIRVHAESGLSLHYCPTALLDINGHLVVMESFT